MAISVKDIQEKDFTPVTGEGYDMDEVDDFLDELVKQLAQEQNLAAQKDSELRQAKQELADAKAELEAIKSAPVDDTPKDGEYFEDLKKVVREALISAQRLSEARIDSANTEADRITREAEEEAQKLLDAAQADADQMLAAAREENEKLSAQAEKLKASLDNYRESFRRLVEAQTAALEE